MLLSREKEVLECKVLPQSLLNAANLTERNISNDVHQIQNAFLRYDLVDIFPMYNMPVEKPSSYLFIPSCIYKPYHDSCNALFSV